MPRKLKIFDDLFSFLEYTLRNKMLKNFQNINSLSTRHLSMVSASFQLHKIAAFSPENRKTNVVLIDAVQRNNYTFVHTLNTDVAHSHDDHGGHGHHAVNHGPPITYDYLTIPSQPYKKVYKELTKKFQMYLAMSFIFFSFCLYVGYFYDVLGYAAWRLPGSYRNRKAINARLDAEEAKAKAEQSAQ